MPWVCDCEAGRVLPCCYQTTTYQEDLGRHPDMALYLDVSPLLSTLCSAYYVIRLIRRTG